MQIEKLTENKIRITLNLDDLKDNNINFHDFMASPIESQDLFYYILNKAEEEVGFKTKDYKLMIEVLASSEGKFILTVTRMAPEGNFTKKIQGKRKNIKLTNNSAVYCFYDFEDYINFCNSIKTSFDTISLSKLKKSILYSYNSKYYLSININNSNLKDFKPIHCFLIEFATHIPDSDLFERKLIEYGKIIFKTNAINKNTKYFN